ncbi:DUF6894 family protein [Rhizobium leguminosarum]|uniref:DUF6894 family protein n=1 Tax=Rhizobium leguminosarum TaxID=384 RepID=UPI00391D013A
MRPGSFNAEHRQEELFVAPEVGRFFLSTEEYSLPKYFFHIRRKDVFEEDLEGVDLASPEQASEEAIAAAREIVAERIRRGESADGDTFERNRSLPVRYPPRVGHAQAGGRSSPIVKTAPSLKPSNESCRFSLYHSTGGARSCQNCCRGR